MPDDSLLVPVLLVNGSIHFATVSRNATVQVVIDTILAQPGVREEALKDLTCDSWALQKIRKENSGRTWEEEDLKGLTEGM
jgi:diaphanous 1